MKQIVGFLFISMVVLTGTSCFPDYNLPMRFGFDSPFNEKSSGLVVMHVGNKNSSVYLEGNVKLLDGGVEIELVNPANEVVYSKILNTCETVVIHEIFSASQGFWKLRYTSKNGTGTLDLHAGY